MDRTGHGDDAPESAHAPHDAAKGAADYKAINAAKAEWGEIYDSPDPRLYFKTLAPLDYSIPSQAKPLFQKLIRHLRTARNRPMPCVLDLGCSYGINGALLKHDLSMDDLYAHWTRPGLDALSSDAVLAEDRRHFGAMRAPDALRIIGVDKAGNAAAYAKTAGLVDEGLRLDLENDALAADVQPMLATADLLISTGCVGYVTETTFERLLPVLRAGRPAWLANFVLRLFPFDGIAETLAERGYVTEKLEGRYFRQRLFADAAEQDRIVKELDGLGIYAEGLEADGHLIAEFHLSRPAADVQALPLEALLRN